MKKMIAGLFTAVLMAAGLVGVSEGSASADCGAYSGCVDTRTTVHGPFEDVFRHNVARIRVRVHPIGSNVQPLGNVQVIVRRVRDGAVYYRETKAYEGGKLVFISPKLHKRGKYTVLARYKPRAGSVFNSSQGTDTFRVVSRPR